jgi:hypothetical protein
MLLKVLLLFSKLKEMGKEGSRYKYEMNEGK